MIVVLLPALRHLLSGFWLRRFRSLVPMRRLRGLFSPIELVVGTPIAPRDATPERLRAAVLALRGEAPT